MISRYRNIKAWFNSPVNFVKKTGGWPAYNLSTIASMYKTIYRMPSITQTLSFAATVREILNPDAFQLT